MDIDSKSKVLLLLGNDILTENGLFVFLEALDFKIKSYTVLPSNLRIIIDKSVYKEIRTLEENNKRQEYIRIKGIISILKGLNVFEEIDTSGLRDFKPFINLLETHVGFSLHFVTNQANDASRFNLEKGKHKVVIEKLVEDEFIPWEFEEAKEEEPTVVKKVQRKMEEAFFTTPKDQLVSISDFPELDYVYSEKYGFLQLDKDNIMFGGEGKIYRTYENVLVKIYSIEQRRYETIKKIQLLMDMDLRNKYIVWPKDIVYNNNEFVGYCMEEVMDAKGLDMSRIYSFQNISYQDRFKICLDLLKLIQYLHERDILIGDLKFDNILLTNKSKELYIIDSGSFQLEDYSCGVFNADYTSTELKGRNLREVLRTLEDEYFPINKILFEVLMGKGPFYDFQTGEVGSDVERHFHYPMDYNKKVDNQQNPLFYWVNGDERLRFVFNDYFAKGIITDTEQWIKLLEDILYKGGK